MKKIMLFICFFAGHSAVFSQTDANYNYSIGVRAFSYTQSPKILEQTNAHDYQNVYFNGLIVKFNDNQISYRVGANYYKKDITFNNVCNTCEIVTGSVKDYSFTIGFEKNFNYGKIQPYFGTDIGFKANNFDGNIRPVDPNSAAQPTDVDASKTGLVIAPLLGIRVSPVSRFSFFAEVSSNFYYSYERQETIQQGLANTRTFSKFNKWDFLIVPVSVGIQIHFVNKD